MSTTIERRRIPTDAQMQNWLDARVNEIASTYGRDGDLLPYKAGVLEGQLIVCLIDPDKIERLRAEILSFPEERP